MPKEKAAEIAEINKFIHRKKSETKKIVLAKKAIRPFLPKSVPGYARYDFHLEEIIINRATGTQIKKEWVSKNVYAFRLVNDHGKTVRLYPEQLKTLLEEIASKPPRYVKKVPTRKKYAKLTKAQIDEILKLETPKQVELAGKYNVHESTISRIINKKTRKRYFENGL